MTHLAAWLIAVGCADLTRPGGAPPRGRCPARGVAVGLVALVACWGLLGAPRGQALAVWAGLALLLVAWVVASVRAVDAGRTTPLLAVPEPGPAPGGPYRRVALASLAAGTLLALATNGHAPDPAPWFAHWFDGLHLASLRGVPAGRALVVLGVLLAQVGTANVVVRLGLDAAGARSEPGVLRGGRLIGPLERLFVVGLGLAGQATAASVVIAAKSLIRFPELSTQGAARQRIDVVTEYFVVGSLVSWLVALLGVVLARA